MSNVDLFREKSIVSWWLISQTTRCILICPLWFHFAVPSLNLRPCGRGRERRRRGQLQTAAYPTSAAIIGQSLWIFVPKSRETTTTIAGRWVANDQQWKDRNWIAGHLGIHVPTASAPPSRRVHRGPECRCPRRPARSNAPPGLPHTRLQPHACRQLNPQTSIPLSNKFIAATVSLVPHSICCHVADRNPNGDETKQCVIFFEIIKQFGVKHSNCRKDTKDDDCIRTHRHQSPSLLVANFTAHRKELLHGRKKNRTRKNLVRGNKSAIVCTTCVS